jgi:DNA ligase-associated metallophosphoesterase
MTLAPLHLVGEPVLLDPLGAMVWPARRLLAVADLHLEKGSAAALRGSLLPPWDTHTTLERLALLLRRHRPEIVVAVGDSFHDGEGADRLEAADAARLARMTEAARFVWVLGNHDPAPPAGIGGEAVEEFAADPFIFRHQGGVSGNGEICGHHHPKATITARGGAITRPCFVTDGHRLMLPAIGAYTGGLDVRDPAIGALFPRGGRVFLLGRERLFSFALTRPARRAVPT